MSRTLIAGAVLGAGLVSGGMLIQSGSLEEAGAATGSARLFEQVLARVRQDFIDTVSVDDLHIRAAAGLLKEIEDPHSTLLTPERYRRLREMTTGRYAGVGLELDIRDGFVTVIAPLAGTPADSAGIRAGDRILTIDDKPTTGLTMEEVQQALRGASGTRVRLTIERGAEHQSLTLTRREITYHPVQRTALTNGVAYVELATFGERADRQVRRVVDSLRAGGARSLILDLRENPGGLLEQGLAVAELFIDSGQTIASTRGRTPEVSQEFEDETPGLWPDLPIVVLVDSGTASAAEIVAGALQDHGRAVLVGSRTYGKGSAQSVFPVAGGRAVKLTTALWFTPKGRTIERDSTGGGIQPDITVTSAVVAATGGGDPVIDQAMELLDGITNPAELRARLTRRR